MKKNILLFAALIYGISLFGQVSIGLTAGNNFCKMKQTIDYSSNPSLIQPDKNEILITNGFIIGIPLEINLSERLSLLTMFSYMQKGSKIETTINASEYIVAKYSGTTKFNYLELPVQCKFYLIKKTLNAYLLVGPSFGYMINGRFKYTFNTIDIEEGTTSNVSYDEKIKSRDIDDAGIYRLDISLAIGVGIGYKVGIGDLFFNINYNHGIRNMNKGEDDVNEGIKQYNRGLATTIGYLIPLSK